MKVKSEITSLIKQITEEPPQNARWIFDGMGIIRAFKPNKTYGDFFDSVYQYLKSCTKNLLSVSIELINDVYRCESIESHAREKRGSLSVSYTHLTLPTILLV